MKTEYLAGSFIDYEGRDRQFILAAVSVNTAEVDAEVYCNELGEDGFWYTSTATSVPKGVYVGISVCHPNDVYDAEIGMTIARGKALNDKSRLFALYTTESGVISSHVVKALLEQESKHISVNPGKYIAGYDDAKARFTEKLYYKTLVDELSDEQVGIVEHLASLDEEKLEEIMYIVSKMNPNEK